MPKTFKDTIKANTKIPDKYIARYYQENFPSLTTGAQLTISIYPFIRESTLRKIDRVFDREEINYLKKIRNSEKKPELCSSKDLFISKLNEIITKVNTIWIKSIPFDTMIGKISVLDNTTVIILSEYLIERKRYSKRGEIVKDINTVTVRLSDSYVRRYYIKHFPNLSVGVQTPITLYPSIREDVLDKVKEFDLNKGEIRYLIKIINAENDPRFCYSTKSLTLKIVDLEKVMGLSMRADFGLDNLIKKISQFDDVTAIILSEYLISAPKKILIKDIIARFVK